MRVSLFPVRQRISLESISELLENTMLSIEYWIIVGVTAMVIAACVAVHYEGLRLLDRLQIRGFNDRHRIVLMILAIMLLHIVEVWLFGVTYYVFLLDGDYGSLEGMQSIEMFDTVYFSATVFSTLGFGDIVPVGIIRFLVGTESIAGLTLITWSASFTFVEMMKQRGDTNG
jgi:hypothetical protein